jgi:GNAT superfamily N-acetyltransferase
MLRDIAAEAPGVVAIDGGSLAGFLLGTEIGAWRGAPSVFSPEWANAAKIEDSRRIYEAMYAQASARWHAVGNRWHVLSILANDSESVLGLHWLGFGLATADGVRDLLPASGSSAYVEIRRGIPQDIAELVALDEALAQHMAAAPVFLARRPHNRRERLLQWLTDPCKATWFACEQGVPVAFFRQGPASDRACDIIVDDATTSIVGAYTVESRRRRGIATALLNRCLEWGRSQRYTRCAVDFESMNLLAARFWMKYFQPVCYTMARYIGEGAIPHRVEGKL